jgi:hypothetical protein
MACHCHHCRQQDLVRLYTIVVQLAVLPMYVKSKKKLCTSEKNFIISTMEGIFHVMDGNAFQSGKPQTPVQVLLVLPGSTW